MQTLDCERVGVVAVVSGTLTSVDAEPLTKIYGNLGDSFWWTPSLALS
jgi:hypothetical protein